MAAAVEMHGWTFVVAPTVAGVFDRCQIQTGEWNTRPSCLAFVDIVAGLWSLLSEALLALYLMHRVHLFVCSSVSVYM